MNDDERPTSQVLLSGLPRNLDLLPQLRNLSAQGTDILWQDWIYGHGANR